MARHRASWSLTRTPARWVAKNLCGIGPLVLLIWYAVVASVWLGDFLGSGSGKNMPAGCLAWRRFLRQATPRVEKQEGYAITTAHLQQPSAWSAPDFLPRSSDTESEFENGKQVECQKASALVALKQFTKKRDGNPCKNVGEPRSATRKNHHVFSKFAVVRWSPQITRRSRGRRSRGKLLIGRIPQQLNASTKQRFSET